MMDYIKAAGFIIETSRLLADEKCKEINTGILEMDYLTGQDEEDDDVCKLVGNKEAFAQINNNSAGYIITFGIQALECYEEWKNGSLTDAEYAARIIRSVSDEELADNIAGAIIPIQKAVSVMGSMTTITFPIAFVAASKFASIIEKCIQERYDKDLLTARFYHSAGKLYEAFSLKMKESSEELKRFSEYYKRQETEYHFLKQKDTAVSKALTDLYDSI